MRIQNSILTVILAAAGGIFLWTSCKKDKYTTRPQLTFKSVKNYNVERGELIEFTLQFTDKEGDISDTLYIQNRTASCPLSDYPKAASFKVPNFPTSTNIKGEFKIIFENGTNNTQNAIYTANRCGKPDTTRFFFWIKDKANNISDTISTDKPLIIQN